MTESTRGKLDDIVGLIRDGRIGAAEDLCRATLAGAADDVNLLGLLGAILIKRGRWDDAERTLLRTVELEPGFARPHEDLGALYLARNRPDLAVTFFERAVRLAPGQVSAEKGLIAALQRAGRAEEAAARRLGTAGANPLAARFAEADGLRRDGEFDAAERLCQDILKREPDNLSALRTLAKIATDQERFAVAEGHLRHILKIAPEHAGALLDLARFLGQRGRYPEATSVLEQASQFAADNPEFHLLHGDILAIIGRSAEALRCYQRCLALRPDDPQALLGAGHMLRIEGRRDDAEASYRRCTEVRPDLGDAWWNLAGLRGVDTTDTEVATMLEQAAREPAQPESAVAFHFALARAFERRRDYARAWEHYSIGNARKRALVRYDPVETEVQQQAIRDTFTAELFARGGAVTPKDRTPLFIVGMPRSGSTLVEQILASHSAVAGAGELPYVIMLTNAVNARRSDGVVYPELVPTLAPEELTGLGRSYLHYARTHTGDSTAFFTDKMPANFSHVGFIRLILPHAKIIDARRDPVATCVANYRQLFAQGKNQTYDLTELGEYYLQYVATMDHWDAVIPGAVLRVRYEEVVADLEGQVRRLLEFCGLPFEDACIEFHKSERPVNTASSEQVREPIYTSAVEFWKNFDPWLDELREVLAPVL